MIRGLSMHFYVNPLGNDTHPGTEQQPFATVAAAKEAVRTQIAEGLCESITVHIAEGNYSTPVLCFTAEDSGTEDCPITYIADGQVVLNGGVWLDPACFSSPSEEIRAVLHGDARSRVVCCDLTVLGLTRADWGEMCIIGSHHSGHQYDDVVLSPMWCELFVNDHRMTIARYPNEGYLDMGEPISVGDSWTKHGYNRWIQMRNPTPDIYSIDRETAHRAASWKFAPQVWMFGFPAYDWADMSTPIVKIDTECCSMEAKYVSMFSARAADPNDTFSNGGRYYLYNVLDELDVPGEWYLDRENGILYLYPPCDMADAEIHLSIITDGVLSFADAEHLNFVGFTVLGTRADGICGSGRYLTLENCTVKNCAGNGITLKGSHNRVIGCEITRTGKGGISLTGGDRMTLTRGENLVENCYVHDFSEIYMAYQSGVYLGGVGNIARHNEICNTPHMAIGYSGNDHLIEYNDIHDAVLCSTDAGAIYAGFDWAAHGTILRYNRIFNIGNDPFRPSGIYWDDGFSGQTAYGNILIGIPGPSFMIGGGRDNIVEGNLVIDSNHAAVEYDDRHRDGYINGGWAKDDTQIPDGKHWKVLAQVPYTSGIWAAKYPHLAALKTDPETDANDPDFPINPAYSSVSHNVIVAPHGNAFAISDAVYTYSTIENNHIYETGEAVDWDENTRNLSPDSIVYSEVPAFTPIPAEKIGRRYR